MADSSVTSTQPTHRIRVERVMILSSFSAGPVRKTIDHPLALIMTYHTFATLVTAEGIPAATPTERNRPIIPKCSPE